MNEQENTRVVQEAYAAFQRGDIKGLLDSLSDDIDWFEPVPSSIMPHGGHRHGRDQVAEFFRLMDESQEAEQFEPGEFFARGEKVVVLGKYRWRVKSSGRTFASDWVHVFTIQNGKIAAFMSTSTPTPASLHMVAPEQPRVADSAH